MNMIEHLISKGVKKHFNGQVVLFSVESLEEHFDGLHIHDTDIIEVEKWEDDEFLGKDKFIKASDVNFDGAVAKEVEPILEETMVDNSELVASIKLPENASEGISYELQVSEPKIEVEVTEETLNDNPELVDEVVSVGEIITVDAEEVKAEPVAQEVAPVAVEKVAKTRKSKK